MNFDVTYVVMTASLELGYNCTNDDILDMLDPEIRRVDGSVQQFIIGLQSIVC